ncbi:hypothetical protein CSUI_002229 [Cystoisospora suis]|uniref:Uncharacterized protein n=1 Tax=Cystoisospora suis TaxID=483139 RepID=A0A2C6L8W8_9APIC|nr:hypothetical protein CSUI_002229 [Cystoisospora suis]
MSSLSQEIISLKSEEVKEKNTVPCEDPLQKKRKQKKRAKPNKREDVEIEKTEGRIEGEERQLHHPGGEKEKETTKNVTRLGLKKKENNAKESIEKEKQKTEEEFVRFISSLETEEERQKAYEEVERMVGVLIRQERERRERERKESSSFSSLVGDARTQMEGGEGLLPREEGEEHVKKQRRESCQAKEKKEEEGDERSSSQYETKQPSGYAYLSKTKTPSHHSGNFDTSENLNRRPFIPPRTFSSSSAMPSSSSSSGMPSSSSSGMPSSSSSGMPYASFFSQNAFHTGPHAPRKSTYEQFTQKSASFYQSLPPGKVTKNGRGFSLTFRQKGTWRVAEKTKTPQGEEEGENKNDVYTAKCFEGKPGMPRVYVHSGESQDVKMMNTTTTSSSCTSPFSLTETTERIIDPIKVFNSSGLSLSSLKSDKQTSSPSSGEAHVSSTATTLTATEERSMDTKGRREDEEEKKKENAVAYTLGGEKKEKKEDEKRTERTGTWIPKNSPIPLQAKTNQTLPTLHPPQALISSSSSFSTSALSSSSFTCSPLTPSTTSTTTMPKSGLSSSSSCFASSAGSLNTPGVCSSLFPSVPPTPDSSSSSLHSLLGGPLPSYISPSSPPTSELSGGSLSSSSSSSVSATPPPLSSSLLSSASCSPSARGEESQQERGVAAPALHKDQASLPVFFTPSNLSFLNEPDCQTTPTHLPQHQERLSSSSSSFPSSSLPSSSASHSSTSSTRIRLRVLKTTSSSASASSSASSSSSPVTTSYAFHFSTEPPSSSSSFSSLSRIRGVAVVKGGNADQPRERRVLVYYPLGKTTIENEGKKEEREVETGRRDKEEEEENHDHLQKEKTPAVFFSSKEVSSSSSSPPVPLYHSFHPPSSSSFSKPVTGISSELVEGRGAGKQEKSQQEQQEFEEKKEEREVSIEEKVEKPQASPRRSKMKLRCVVASLRKKNPTLLSGQGEDEEEEAVVVETKNDDVSAKKKKKKNTSDLFSCFHTSSSSLSSSKISSSTLLKKASAEGKKRNTGNISSSFSTPSEEEIQKELIYLDSFESTNPGKGKEKGGELPQPIEGHEEKLKKPTSEDTSLSFSSQAKTSPFFFGGGIAPSQGKEEKDREEDHLEERRETTKKNNRGGVLPLFSYLNVRHETCRCSSSSSSATSSSSSNSGKRGVRTTNGIACDEELQRKDGEKTRGLSHNKDPHKGTGGDQDERQEKKRDGHDEKQKNRLFSTQAIESLQKGLQNLESEQEIWEDVRREDLGKETSSFLKKAHGEEEEEKRAHHFCCVTWENTKMKKSEDSTPHPSMSQVSKEGCQSKLGKDHMLKTDEELRNIGDVYSAPNLKCVKQQESDVGRGEEEEERDLLRSHRSPSLKKSWTKNEEKDANQKRKKNMREEAKDKLGVLEKAVKSFLEKSKKSDEVLQTRRQKEEEQEQQQGVSPGKNEDARGGEKEPPQKRKTSSFFFSSSSSSLSSSPSGKKDRAEDNRGLKDAEAPRVATPQGEEEEATTVKEEEREVLSMSPLELLYSNKKNLSEKIKASTRVRNLFEKMRNRDTPPVSRVGERATDKQEEGERGKRDERDRTREKEEQQERAGENREYSTGLAGPSPDSLGTTSKKETDRFERRTHRHRTDQQAQSNTPSKDYSSKNNSPASGIRDLFSFIGSFFGSNSPSENDDREKGRNRKEEQTYVQTERGIGQNGQDTPQQTESKEEEKRGKKEE